MNSDSQSICRKIDRVRRGGRPRVLDLFAGCGGLSLGFHAAGFTVAAAVEIDPDAAASHGRNFHDGDPRHSKARDITALTPEALAASWISVRSALAIDVLVGGPPCQAFARVGRPKLREIDEHPQAFKHDPRAQLYLEYLRYVDGLPAACRPDGERAGRAQPRRTEHRRGDLRGPGTEGLCCALHAAERGLLRRAADARAHVSDRLPPRA